MTLNNNILVNLQNNPDYHFTANTGDDEDRFVIHFFNPTSVREYDMDQITKWRHYLEQEHFHSR